MMSSSTKDDLAAGTVRPEIALGLSDEELLEKTPGGSDKYFLLHGVIQHDLYHGGQMAQLKRAIRLANPARN